MRGVGFFFFFLVLFFGSDHISFGGTESLENVTQSLLVNVSACLKSISASLGPHSPGTLGTQHTEQAKQWLYKGSVACAWGIAQVFPSPRLQWAS